MDAPFWMAIHLHKKKERQCLLYLIQIFVNRADQLEFMTLCNIKEFSLSEKKNIAEMSVGKASLKLDNLDLMHRIDEMIVKTVKSEIETFEKDPENAEKILKICNIFASNWFLDLGNLLLGIDNKVWEFQGSILCLNMLSSQ